MFNVVFCANKKEKHIEESNKNILSPIEMLYYFLMI